MDGGYHLEELGEIIVAGYLTKGGRFMQSYMRCLGLVMTKTGAMPFEMNDSLLKLVGRN